MMRYLFKLALFLATFLFFTACSQFHEQYLFRSGRPGKANYYRVTISGTTSFTTSQFAAGLYDAEAVDSLFGELKGPGKLVSIGGTSIGQPEEPQHETDTVATAGLTLVAKSDAESKTKPVQTLEGKPVKDQKFVFFLSSNANAFINQIQTYVESNRIQTAMVSLILRGDVEKLEAARASERVALARANSLAAALSSAVAGLGTGENAKSEEVGKVAVKLLSLLANRSEAVSPASFATVQEAEDWLRGSPRAFRMTGGAR